MAGLRDDVELPQVRQRWLAKVALELATARPGLIFRNPEKVAEERLNAFYRHRQEAALARRPARRRPPNLPGLDVPAFEFPPDLRDAGTVGIIYAETDGLNFL